MSFIRIAEESNFPDAEELVTYYESNILKIAEILKRNRSDIPTEIALCFEEGRGAAYNRREKRIVFRYENRDSLLMDKGRLIHEAAHVVQDYQFDLVEGSVPLHWAEGIADYCRLKLDPDFRTETTLPCEPERGYKKAAYFLEWLSTDNPSIVVDIDMLIRDMRLNIKDHDDIFCRLLGTSLNDLKRECIADRHAKQR